MPARTASEDATMDPRIWSRTPPIIQELVFARLPLQSLLQLRLLSKHWLSYLISPAFQLAFSDGRPKEFAVVESERTDPKRVWAYDALASRWFTRPLSYLPFSYLVAADGGLLCFVKYTKPEERLQVVVCNPLTCTWRELPPALGVQEFPTSVRLSVDVDLRQYTIEFVGSWDVKEFEVFHVYSSVTNSWVRLGWSSDEPDMARRYFLIDLYGRSLRTMESGSAVPRMLLDPPHFESDGGFLEDGALSLLLVTQLSRKRTSGEPEPPQLEPKWEHLSDIPAPAGVLQDYFFSPFLLGDSILLLFGKRRKLILDAAHEISDDLGHDSNNKNLMLIMDMSTNTWSDVTNHNMERDFLSRSMVELRLDAVP